MLLRRTRSFFVALLVVTVIAGACSSDDDTDAAPATTPSSAEDASTTSSTPEVEALDTAALGPYAVGRRSVTVTDPSRDGRALAVDIWYPTDAAGGEPSTYRFAPGIEYDSDVALDAPPVSADSGFPLVVYSHGSGGVRYVASYFTETLASHGVVVVAPDHVGNTAIERLVGTSDPSEVISRNRPLDVSAVISAMLDGTVDAEVTAAIDADHIGVAGHSFGAYTALAIGGGAEASGVDADDRVGALVAMAPAANGLSDADLAAVDVPTLVISGTLDTTTPIDPNTDRVADLVAGRPLIRVDLDGATHQSFTDVCDYTVLLPTLPDIAPAIIEFVDDLAENTCDPDVLDVERAHELIDRYVIAFLLAELTGSDGAQAALDAADRPDEVEITVLT